MYMRMLRLSSQEVITRHIQHSIGRDIHNRSTEFNPLLFTLTFENSSVKLPTIESADAP